MTTRRLSTFALAAAALAALPSCSGDFDPASKIQSVRILGLKADKPYAKPGDTVSLEMLAVDRRPNRDRPMTIYWLPIVCTNPPNDAYFGCFTPRAQLTGPNGEAGAPGGVVAGAGDVTGQLPKGATFAFKVPANAVTAHPPVPGSNGPYGLSIVFYLACAGRVRFATRDEASANPQQVPLFCVDDDGNRLGADDYVLGFWRTYVYDDRPNANPVIDGVRVNGEVADVTKPIAITACADRKSPDCAPVKVDVVVPPSSQEDKPYDPDAPRERVWVSASADVGDVGSATRLLYDTKAGALSDNPIELRGDFDDVGKSGTLWLVVRDNRGGAAWTSVPLTVVRAP
jgi:hypothetical protein